ncbi:AAA family ATPase [Gordonia sp. NPDC003429]
MMGYGENYSDDGVLLDENGDPHPLRNVIDGHDLDKRVFAPLEWTVPQVIPEGFGLLAAPPKAGKSWLVAGTGLACASGGKALGYIDVAQRPCLYLALEDSHRRLQARYRQLLANQPIPRDMHSLTGLAGDSVTAVIRAFMERHKGRKPVVFLDTIGKVRPPRRASEDSYHADYAVGSALKRIVDDHPGSSLVGVHHTRKMESDDFVDSVSGTNGLAGAADFVLVLARKRQSEEGILHITGRDVDEAELALVMDNGTWRLSSPSVAQASSDAQSRRERGNKGDRTLKALEYVKGRKTTTPLELSTWLDISANDAGTYLRRMYSDGLIDKVSRGVYKPLSSVSEVSETDQTNRQTDTTDTPSQTNVVHFLKETRP